MTEEPPEEVGTVAEEAAKLLGALKGWAQDNVGDHEGASGTRRGTSALLHELNEHIATGGTDCRYCPVCQVIAAVRETSPEVKAQLSTAATSLMHAATGVLEAYGERVRRAEGDARHGGRDGVERIDLADEGDPGWEDETWR